MTWTPVRLATCFVLISQTFSMAFAQLGGARAGVDNFSQLAQGGLENGPPLLTRETVESYISVAGRAEVRVQPTQIRIVLAVTSTEKTAQDCQAVVKMQVEKLKSSWLKLNIRKDSMVEDFIALLPTFAWNIEKKGEVDANVESHTGFRMQTNIHLLVKDDEAASAALNAAFAQGITDIIAFDYWSPEIDAAKVRAREEAMKAAKAKADVLLAVFDARPPVINVQEETIVRKPESLYESFVNAVDSEVRNGWLDRNLPTFHAPRPKNTYYKGLQSTGDIQGSALPMKMEISIVSSVRIYYESPATAKREKPSIQDE